MSDRPNILIVMSDEHDPAVTGCYSHSAVHTPAMDRLAENGVVYDNAYTNCPICVPARNSFMTGRYCHEIEAWDNSSPIPSELPTMGSLMEAAGYETVLCGRSHFAGPKRMYGWGKRLLDDFEHWKHIDGRGPKRTSEGRRGSRSHVTECGAGEHWQTDYDQAAAELATRFLENRAERPSENPFLLYVGFINPHFPLVCPEEFLNLYDPESIELPRTCNEPLEAQHPVIQQLRYAFRNDAPLDEEIERLALASYYGLVSFTDHLLGRMLQIIYESHLKDNTVVIYTSDHGEMAGNHGIWQKQCFYENSVRVPIIMNGPDIPAGIRPQENVSLLDMLPTVLDLGHQRNDSSLPGQSLLQFTQNPQNCCRSVFSEYHAQGFLNAGYMLKKEHYKLNWYVGFGPELFDLAEDPEETRNVAEVPFYGDILKNLKTELFNMVDPEEIDKRAKHNQQLTGMERVHPKKRLYSSSRYGV